MKKILMALVLTLATSSAFADHSLASAMQDSAEINSAVRAAMKAKKVVCATDLSLQMTSKASRGQETWRQVALCFSSKKSMEQTLDVLAKGNNFGGLYGLNVDAILDVTYTWSEEATAQKIVSISLK